MDNLAKISWQIVTLLETNISPPKALLKMMFLFPRWDMLVPWRVVFGRGYGNPQFYAPFAVG